MLYLSHTIFRDVYNAALLHQYCLTRIRKNRPKREQKKMFFTHSAIIKAESFFMIMIIINHISKSDFSQNFIFLQRLYVNEIWILMHFQTSLRSGMKLKCLLLVTFRKKEIWNIFKSTMLDDILISTSASTYNVKLNYRVKRFGWTKKKYLEMKSTICEWYENMGTKW